MESITPKKKRLSLFEAQEYLDECFCAYAEGLVLRLTKRKNTSVTGWQTRKYFFEELGDEIYPMDLKLKSLYYNEKARNELRIGRMQPSISQREFLGYYDSKSFEPLYDFLQILALNDYGLPSDFDDRQFVKSLQNSFEELCFRISVKSQVLKSQ